MTRTTRYVACLTRRQLRMLLDPPPEPEPCRTDAQLRRVAAGRARRPEGTLSPAQAAQALGVSRTQLYRLIRRGLLPPPVRLNRKVVYFPADVRKRGTIDA